MAAVLHLLPHRGGPVPGADAGDQLQPHLQGPAQPGGRAAVTDWLLKAKDPSSSPGVSKDAAGMFRVHAGGGGQFPVPGEAALHLGSILSALRREIHLPRLWGRLDIQFAPSWTSGQGAGTLKSWGICATAQSAPLLSA